MVLRRCGIFLFLLTVCLPSCLYSVMPPSQVEKKAFDSLVDVSFTKGRLATQARKTKRIQDLQQLAALMVDHVIAKIDQAVLSGSIKEGYYDLRGWKSRLSPLIAAGRVNNEVMDAKKYATHAFDVKYEELLNNAFRSNFQNMLKKSQAKMVSTEDLKAATFLETVLNKWQMSAEDITLAVFFNKLQGASQDTRNELLKYIPNKGQINAALIRSLEDFNYYYKPVIDGIFAVNSQAILQVPRSPLTIDYFKGEVEEETCAICFEPLEAKLSNALPCGHKFHRQCIENWIQRGNNTCPFCRQPINL